MKIKYLFYLLLVSALTTVCSSCGQKTVYIDMPNKPATVNQKNNGVNFEPIPEEKKRVEKKEQKIPPPLPVIKPENLTPVNYTEHYEEKTYTEVIYSGGSKITISGKSTASSSGNGKASSGVEVTVRKK